METEQVIQIRHRDAVPRRDAAPRANAPPYGDGLDAGYMEVVPQDHGRFKGLTAFG